MHESDLWVHRRDGYFVYRIPALVTTTAGTVLAFCEGRRHTGHDHDEIDILVRRSFDAGLTWDPPRAAVHGGSHTCGNPCPIVDGTTGVVWLLFCRNNQEVFCTRSDDDGARWAEPREITATAKDPSWAFVGTGPCHGIQLSSGRLLAPSWCDESPGPVRWRPRPSWGVIQSSYAIYSDDHGQSWTRGEMLTRDASDECAAVETADGGVYLNARSRGGRQQRARAWSRDGGHTWTGVEYDPGQPEPSCQGQPGAPVEGPRPARPSLGPAGAAPPHPADEPGRVPELAGGPGDRRGPGGLLGSGRGRRDDPLSLRGGAGPGAVAAGGGVAHRRGN